MPVQIDARLHLSEPEIILRSPGNGKILMRWKANKVQQWIEQGDITCNELSETHYHWLELLQSTR
jgi:hypothetical protein